MAAFDLETVPRDLNGGVKTYDTRTVLPTTSISSARASTFTTTIFEWLDSAAWWLPSQSYFSVRGHFTDASGNALARSANIAYCDNWVSTLFTRITLELDGKTIESIEQVPQADTMNLYSTVDRTYLESFASASGVGEGLMTRINNSSQFGTASVSASNYNEVVATWRPPCGVFNIPTGVPPGARWRLTYTWNRNAEQNVVQSAAAALAGTAYFFYVDDFFLSYATVQPEYGMPLPDDAVLDINSIQANVYSIASSQTTLNCTIPSRTTRVLIAYQDNATASASTTAGGNGLKPFTDFTLAATGAGGDFTAYLTSVYGNFTELGYTFPQTQYNFVAGSAAGAKTDLQRAYADWINITRGCSGGYEGSVPFGAYDVGIGAAILNPLTTSSANAVMQVGDPSNNQQVWIASAAAATIAATVGNQTARWGWLGKVPIFAFPVVRPEGREVSKFNLYSTFSAAVTSANCFVVALYTNTILCRKVNEYGLYKYDTSLVGL